MAHYNLLVIGTGPAGQKAAVQAAKLGKKVGLIERKEVVGGVCINTGTIPSKALREAALFFSGIPQRSIYGTPHQLKNPITIEELTFHANHVIKNEIRVVHAQMARNRIDMIFGSASFFDPHCLRIQHQSGSIEQQISLSSPSAQSQAGRPKSRSTTAPSSIRTGS
jgi:NAD(P) transhydrogenase